MEAGLNLYSLRQLVHTEQDFSSLAEELKAMGYSYLQVSGLPLKAEEIARVSKESGLPVYLTHSPLDRILNETDTVMEENAVFGCRNIGLGYFPPEVIADENKCKDTVSKLNEVALRLKKNGFTFFLHHHHNEFLKHGNQTVFDYILENAPEVHIIVDTYWLQYGGVNTVGIFEKLKGRAECIHLKDYQLRLQKNSAWCEPHFAPVGTGTLDFTAIVNAAKKAGAKYFFVEQDDAGEYPDPLTQVGKSIRFVKSEL